MVYYNLTANSISGVFSYSLALPYFSLAIIILIIGIVYMQTRKLSVSLIAGFVLGLVLYQFIPSNALLNTLLIIGVSIILAILESVIAKHR